ncbi:MAG: GNAT family N-acetyltransferase, partial [Chloroflexi bacterium]|nr:GNAT family N-acetyltransferase [Chloroflexota bacterium]
LVAQARYDRISADVAEIDYAVAPGFRGRGLGAEALKRSGELAFDALGVERLRGVVVEDNTASVRVFEKLGYKRVGDKTMKGHRVYIFERGR